MNAALPESKLRQADNTYGPTHWQMKTPWAVLRGVLAEGITSPEEVNNV